MIAVLLIALAFVLMQSSAHIATAETRKRILSSFGVYATLAAMRYNLESLLILSVVAVESSGRTDAKGAAGERGLMQLMEGTFNDVNRRFSLGLTWSDMYSAQPNIMAGSAYLSMCLKAFSGNVTKALQAYNGGIAGVEKNPLLSLAYAERVLSTYRAFHST